MVIAPTDYQAEREAVLENKDVGFVKVGQHVEVKVETFPITRYGTPFISNTSLFRLLEGSMKPLKLRFRCLSASMTIAAASVLAGCAVPGLQAYWDMKVREMCAKDGGVIIYRKLHLSKVEAKLLSHVGGKLDVPIKELADPAAPAYGELRKTTIKRGSPGIARTEATIFRREDRAILARWVVYTRSGGDILTIDHPSTYRCPETKKMLSDLQPLFVIEGVLQ